MGRPAPTRTTVPDLTDDEAGRRLARAIELGPRYRIENLPAG